MTTHIFQGDSLADIAAAKRLLFDNQTMVVASKVNVNEQSTVKKVPIAEREKNVHMHRHHVC